MAAHPDVVTVAIGALLTALVTIIFFARIYTRLRIVRDIGLDDVFIGFAFLVTFPYNIDQMMATRYGLGLHEKTLTEHQIHNYYVTAFIMSTLYAVALGFIKASVLALFIRLGHAKLSIVSRFVLAIVLMQMIANFFVSIFQCAPIRAKWDYTITHKRCININLFFLIQTCLNLATDWLVYALPLPVIFKMHVSPKAKIVIGYNLCLGLFACIASVLRLYYVARVVTQEAPDRTYLSAWKMGWAMVEVNVGFIAVSLPSLRPLVKRLAPGLLGERKERRSSPQEHMERATRNPTRTNPSILGVEWSGWTVDNGIDLSNSLASEPSIRNETFVAIDKSIGESHSTPASTLNCHLDMADRNENEANV